MIFSIFVFFFAPSLDSCPSSALRGNDFSIFAFSSPRARILALPLRSGAMIFSIFAFFFAPSPDSCPSPALHDIRFTDYPVFAVSKYACRPASGEDGCGQIPFVQSSGLRPPFAKARKHRPLCQSKKTPVSPVFSKKTSCIPRKGFPCYFATMFTILPGT